MICFIVLSIHREKRNGEGGRQRGDSHADLLLQLINGGGINGGGPAVFSSRVFASKFNERGGMKESPGVVAVH